MEKVLVDAFVVPEESKAEFLEAARRAQSFIKNLSGFVEGSLLARTAGESRYNFVTTAVWKDEQAFENAKRTVALEYHGKKRTWTAPLPADLSKALEFVTSNNNALTRKTSPAH